LPKEVGIGRPRGTLWQEAESRRPIHNAQTGHRAEVGVLTHDGALAQCQCDGCELHVDLLHGSSSSPSLGGKSPVFFRSFSCVRPERKAGNGPDQPRAIRVARLAKFDSEEQLTKNRHACAKSCAAQSSLSGTVVDALAAID
jgi:hypothetical protein